MTCFPTSGVVVVDTNVARAANGDANQASLECQKRCVDVLEKVIAEAVVVVDNRWRILGEYRKELEQGTGMGSVFFKHVCRYQYVEDRVRCVSIDEESLPANTLGKDQKFLAAAVSASANVLNAVDSDWKQNEEVTRSLGVGVWQLCPDFAEKTPKE